MQEFPALTPKEREQAAARKYGALFLIGIGGELSDGQRHDGRAPDYDDWSTPTEGGYKGLNGDIIVWNPVLESAFELSSMGIRVDAEALERQLAICGCPERREMEFHRLLLEGRLPLSIGGGIGDRASACSTCAAPISAKSRSASGPADDRRVRRPRHLPPSEAAPRKRPGPSPKADRPAETLRLPGLRKSRSARGFAYFPAAGWSGVWPFLFLL